MDRLLAALVLENSHTRNPEGGNRVGRLIRDALATRSLESSVVASSSFADHLVFRTRAPGRPALLVGHLDTVFEPGTFEGYRAEGDRAFGPGVVDMKGGLVVACFALLALECAGALEQIPLELAIVSDEEVGSPESKAFLRSIAERAAYGLVFEGGRPDDAVITERKGTGSVQVIARGRAAHAGNAHASGVNAIWALAEFVVRAQRSGDPSFGRTVNVGLVEGGTSKNTVPAEAQGEVDLRFTTAQDGGVLLEALERAAREAERMVAGSSIELRGGISRLPLSPNAGTDALVARYLACAREAGLGQARSPLVGGGSDANTLGEAGLACLDGLGPRGSGLHTHDEQIDLTSLVPKASAIARLLLAQAVHVS